MGKDCFVVLPHNDDNRIEPAKRIAMNGGADKTEGLLNINFLVFAMETRRTQKWGIKKSPKLLWRIYIFWSSTKLRLTICNYFLTYITSFTALTTRSAFGKLAAIKVGEYGSGTSAQVIRKTGASK